MKHHTKVLLHGETEDNKWPKSNLSGRSQYVQLNKATTSMVPITSGIIQGFLLSPLLFSLHVKNMANMKTLVKVNMFIV